MLRGRHHGRRAGGRQRRRPGPRPGHRPAARAPRSGSAASSPTSAVRPGPTSPAARRTWRPSTTTAAQHHPRRRGHRRRPDQGRVPAPGHGGPRRPGPGRAAGARHLRRRHVLRPGHRAPSSSWPTTPARPTARRTGRPARLNAVLAAAADAVSGRSSTPSSPRRPSATSRRTATCSPRASGSPPALGRLVARSDDVPTRRHETKGSRQVDAPKLTVPDLAGRKSAGDKIVMITCYDVTFARLARRGRRRHAARRRLARHGRAGPGHHAARHPRRDALPLPHGQPRGRRGRSSSATCRSAPTSRASDVAWSRPCAW